MTDAFKDGMITLFAVRTPGRVSCTEDNEREKWFMHESLADVDRRVVGTKQVLRALDEGRIAHAYIARDADLLLTKRVVDRCYDMEIPARR